MKLKIAKIISILTVVPVIAFALLIILFRQCSYVFNNSFAWCIFAFLFLFLMPISAYGLKNIIPKYRNKGRSGERKLAFITGVMGYIIGTIVCIIFKAPKGLTTIFLSYLVSGIVLTFVNKVIKFKASGHACGVSGPMTLFIYFVGRKAWYALILLPMVFWSRINMGRHTIKELIAGTIIGIVSTSIVIFTYA
ncbi:phosphatase PAP2 family protein [Proteiniborus sp. MB09-C3]|uniref:phosphatase PAP2 family protein n=1 Tax=Proteiniborus sp. MB09-C3 TaxID=3050072 RepID=UPI0025548970|nr:phosphatase PAP2 family protein [Proteiniborus sp. MB09-C3]WIV11946.1 hypothetical protein QO263_17905 [Proteiniborus sp. MB09-C3]